MRQRNLGAFETLDYRSRCVVASSVKELSKPVEVGCRIEAKISHAGPLGIKRLSGPGKGHSLQHTLLDITEFISTKPLCRQPISCSHVCC